MERGRNKEKMETCLQYRLLFVRLGGLSCHTNTEKGCGHSSYVVQCIPNHVITGKAVAQEVDRVVRFELQFGRSLSVWCLHVPPTPPVEVALGKKLNP